MKAWLMKGVNGLSLTLHEPTSEFMKVASFSSASEGQFLSDSALEAEIQKRVEERIAKHKCACELVKDFFKQMDLEQSKSEGTSEEYKSPFGPVKDKLGVPVKLSGDKEYVSKEGELHFPLRVFTRREYIKDNLRFGLNDFSVSIALDPLIDRETFYLITGEQLKKLEQSKGKVGE